MIHEQLNFLKGADHDSGQDVREGVLFNRLEGARMAAAGSGNDRGEVDQRTSDADRRSGNEAAGKGAEARPLKILFFDCETTGVDPRKNGLTQIAGFIEVGGRVVESFDFTVAPFEFDTVEPEALRIQGRTFEQLIQFDAPAVMKAKLTAVLSRHVDKFDKADKYVVAGQNVGFDVDFLAQFFKKCGDNFLGSFLSWRQIDLLRLIDLLEVTTGLQLQNRKLETLSKYFGVELSNAHDALSDIAATRSIINLLLWGKK